MLGYAIDNNKIWFIDEQSGVLMCHNGYVSERYIIDEEKQGFYTDGIVYGDKVYFAPATTNDILSFDKQSKAFSFIRIKTPFDDNKWKRKYDAILKVGGSLYLIPFQRNGDVEIVKLTEGRTEYYNIQHCCEPGVSFRYACAYDDRYILMPEYNSNGLVRFDTITKESCRMKIGELNEKLVDVASDDVTIYVLSKNKGLVYLIDNKQMRIINTIRVESETQIPFRRIFSSGEYLFLAQDEEMRSVIVNKRNGEIRYMDLFKDLGLKNDSIIYTKEIGNEIVMVAPKKNLFGHIGIIDLSSGKISWRSVCSFKDNKIFCIGKRGNAIHEELASDGLSLEDYIEYVKKGS